MNKPLLSFTLLCSVLFITCFVPYSLKAQDDAAQDAGEIEQYKEQIRRLIGFYEFSLNALGDDETTVKEKDVIINESYLKAFRDSDVQIEDDLDPNRELPLNKDVQAYLKDVEFFYKKVEFDYTVKEILPQYTQDGLLYFKVTTSRKMSGINIDNDTIINDQDRYVEINLDEDDQLLKIVSVYTTKLNEARELRRWWNKLPLAWKTILGDRHFVYDTLTLNDFYSFSDSTLVLYRDTIKIVEVDTFLVYGIDTLRIMEQDTIQTFCFDTIPFNTEQLDEVLMDIVSIESLDISNNLYIRNIDPIDKLDNLKELNIANTLVADLFPVRNLSRIEKLNCSGTSVKSLEPLLFSTRIIDLDISSTQIQSLKPLVNFEHLNVLEINLTPIDSLQDISHLITLNNLRMRGCPVIDLSPLSGLPDLRVLDISESHVMSLEPIQFNTSLERIYFDQTEIDNIQFLSKLNKLRLIHCDNSRVKELNGLDNMPELERIYCDGSLVSQATAQSFMVKNPKVLVVYESEALGQWWKKMDRLWKSYFSSMIPLDSIPSKEQLHELILIQEIILTEYPQISSLDPLAQLASIQKLDCSGTAVTNLDPVKSQFDMEYLNFAQCKISDLQALSNLSDLEFLNGTRSNVTDLSPLASLQNLRLVGLDETGISDLSPFSNSSRLEIVYCDKSNVELADVERLLYKIPDCLVVFQTGKLKAWWNGLPNAWKSVFAAHVELDENPSREQFHKIVYLKEVNAKGKQNLQDLSPLKYLFRLESLNCSNTRINSLEPISESYTLRTLDISDNPVEDLTPIIELSDLVALDFRNTSVSDLSVMAHLNQIEKLSCSGTQIKKLNGLEGMYNLKELECYNTDIKNLKPIENLSKLESLKCYNTKLNAKKIAEFKTTHPGVDVVFY